MDSKPDTGRGLRVTYYVREGTYSTYTLQLPSNYSKTIVIITPSMKFGGVVALSILERTTSAERVVLITQRNVDIESLRSQLPHFVRKRFFSRECNLHSALSIKMAVLWLRVALDHLHIVIHLEPQSEDSSNTCHSMKALLCANSCSIELFRKDLLSYFGSGVQYVQVEFPLTENPANVVSKVLSNVFN